MTEKFIGAFGSGIGGPVESVADANHPSFDPCGIKHDDKIAAAINDPRLDERDRTFLMSCYGLGRLSRKQHIILGKILAKVKP